MRVQPDLEPVDVPLESGLRGPSAFGRKVVVDPIGSRLRPVDDDHTHRDHDSDQRGREAEVDDRDGEAARDPEPFQ